MTDNTEPAVEEVAVEAARFLGIHVDQSTLHILMVAAFGIGGIAVHAWHQLQGAAAGALVDTDEDPS